MPCKSGSKHRPRPRDTLSFVGVENDKTIFGDGTHHLPYDMLKVVEAVEQGKQVGESEVSRLVPVDDFVGMSATPEGLQRQIDAVMEFNEGVEIAK